MNAERMALKGRLSELTQRVRELRLAARNQMEIIRLNTNENLELSVENYEAAAHATAVLQKILSETAEIRRKIADIEAEIGD